MFLTQKNGTDSQVAQRSRPAFGGFDYAFPEGTPSPFQPGKLAAFTAFHQAIVANGEGESVDNSPLPPIFTYFGQFISHEITARVAVDEGGEKTVDISGESFEAQPKADVIRAMKNGRSGRFDLGGVYGPSVPTGNAALDKLIGLMRFPKDRAKMWLARPSVSEGGIPDHFPKDGLADLLRLHRLMVDPHGKSAPLFTETDFAALPESVQALLRLQNGEVNMRCAIIGEARNDGNLAISQLQVAFLRFHNRMVDAYPYARNKGDDEVVFTWARQQVRFHYQWLVMNVYLPSVCDPVVLQSIIESNGKLYGGFLQDCDHKAGAHFPVPLEFSAAAFRFCPSMARSSYDWNSAFGRTPGGTRHARFQDLFLFAGVSHNPLGGSHNVPQNCVIDWHRMALPNSGFADRSTNRIDTKISTRVNVSGKPDEENLVARTLKRSIRMSIPAAQSCIEALNTRYGFGIEALTAAELTSGPPGATLEAAGFTSLTPLWYYVLKEAEIRQSGQRLGQLGTHIVAGTIAGLILHDPKSYWNQKGTHEGRWHPVDGARPSGQLVDSIPAMLRAALLIKS